MVIRSCFIAFLLPLVSPPDSRWYKSRSGVRSCFIAFHNGVLARRQGILSRDVAVDDVGHVVVEDRLDILEHQQGWAMYSQGFSRDRQ